MIGWLTALLAGMVTGILSGFGVGGGTLLLVYLTAFAGVPQNQAQGINLLYFLPAAAMALPAHYKNGYIHRPTVGPAAAAGLAAAAVAAWIATAMDVQLLHRCFGGFLLIIGMRELFQKEEGQTPEEKTSEEGRR
ncbi:sulfite exporter TauE/SafE family protein [Pseudoflavonifractor sp. 524-17]|uniref:sulfite exporter TauE/SafE family protein n=1 Tax=Pseudoflavonifractor sp. 524-17 TaxID=2304577 RepID=UPI001FADCBF3|nr:sulfite exporter TauE/SafE family protein [Pseudoflavonifractor sp. 524-17]